MKDTADSPLLTDLYQLTMLQAYFDKDMNDTAVFEFFVRRLPENRNFGPMPGLEQAAPEVPQPVIMTVDEYEAVRLIDLEGMNQEACAEKMRIARTTVQSIYAEARKKLADSLVNGKLLRIEGGEYELCDGNSTRCGMGACHRRRGGGGGFGL